jgi:hypothetical protein
MTVRNKKPENMPLFPDQELGSKKLGPVEYMRNGNKPWIKTP